MNVEQSKLGVFINRDDEGNSFQYRVNVKVEGFSLQMRFWASLVGDHYILYDERDFVLGAIDENKRAEADKILYLKAFEVGQKWAKNCKTSLEDLTGIKGYSI